MVEVEEEDVALDVGRPDGHVEDAGGDESQSRALDEGDVLRTLVYSLELFTWPRPVVVRLLVYVEGQTVKGTD